MAASNIHEDRDSKGNIKGLTTMNESEKAALAKKRGQAAAQISDPEQRRKFIAAQGEAENKSGGTASAEEYGHMDREAEDTLATQGQNKSVGVPSYKDGVDRVPQTGPAKLHKDEAVLNKPQADKYRSAKKMFGLAAGSLSDSKEDVPEKKIKEVRVRRGASGGHIIEHHHVHASHAMEEHLSKNDKELMDHMKKHMGDEAEVPAPVNHDGAAPSDGIAPIVGF